MNGEIVEVTDRNAKDQCFLLSSFVFTLLSVRIIGIGL